MPHILALDNGTQSVRALLFDLDGNLVAKSQVHIQPYVAPQPGWAEQDPDYYWAMLGRACQELWQNPAVDKSQIAGVVLTTQRGTVVNVGKDGRPLRPAMVWLDQRRTEGLPRVGGWWGFAFRLVGMMDTLNNVQAQAEANWLRINQPQIWYNTYKFLFLSGYLTYKLVGRFVDSVGCQVGYVPFDYKKGQWAAKWDWKWLAVPMADQILPDLVHPTEVLGTITAEAAAATGIPEGLQLIAGAADKACEVLGAGGLEPHIGCLSFGTTATFNTTSAKYVEVIPLIPPFPAAVPRAYSLEIQLYRGFWMVSWFKEQFAHEEQAQAAERGLTAEQLLGELVRDVPPGSMGLMLQPYWSPGIRIPGAEAKGAIIGFGDVHTKAHVYRALLEGLIYGLREAGERIARRSRVPITELRVAGGGSQSDEAMQMTADIFGLPTSRPHTYEAAGLGAAVVASVGLGLHPDFATAVRRMTRIGDTFQPHPQHHALYEQLYQRVYKKMYGRLQPLYHAIRDITGYPPS